MEDTKGCCGFGPTRTVGPFEKSPDLVLAISVLFPIYPRRPCLVGGLARWRTGRSGPDLCRRCRGASHLCSSGLGSLRPPTSYRRS